MLGATLCATNSWSVTWSRHFVSVIITIVMGDVRYLRVVSRNLMNIFSRSVWSNTQLKQTGGERMPILLLRTTRQVYSKNVVIITDRKCRDQVTNQELGTKQNVIKRVIGPPAGWVLPDHLRWVRELIWAPFEYWWLKTMAFGNTVDNQKKIMIMLAPALSSACQSEDCVGHCHCKETTVKMNRISFPVKAPEGMQ